MNYTSGGRKYKDFIPKEFKLNPNWRKCNKNSISSCMDWVFRL